MIYDITLINPNQTIGDSLIDINKNYTNLSNWVIDVQKTYNTKYLSVYNFYVKYADKMDLTLSLIQTLSAQWRSFQTTVETNSSKWLQPITIYYPDLIVLPFTNSSINIIKNWLVTNFPIKNSNSSDVNYVEGQQFIINAHTYKIENKINNASFKLFDYTLCYTSNKTIYVYCSDLWANTTVHCSNGNASCGYSRNCSKSAASDCHYTSPYYRNLADENPISGAPNTTQGYSKIEATVRANFTDRIENSFIRSLSFKVLDCDWVFDKFIT
jgi:hypothetical protein